MASKDGRRRFVLCIDDDETIRDLYDAQLPALGFEVYCAPTAKEGKQAAAKRRPDLILVDIMMEGQDGISLLREFRADPATAHVPVILVSGLTDAGTLNDALLFGATDFLTKPFELEVLRTKIDRALYVAQKRQEKKA